MATATLTRPTQTASPTRLAINHVVIQPFLQFTRYQVDAALYAFEVAHGQHLDCHPKIGNRGKAVLNQADLIFSSPLHATQWTDEHLANQIQPIHSPRILYNTGLDDMGQPLYCWVGLRSRPAGASKPQVILMGGVQSKPGGKQNGKRATAGHTRSHPKFSYSGPGLFDGLYENN